jgi:hypothetical protein
VLIYRDARVTDAMLAGPKWKREPWRWGVALAPGERLDRDGQLWRKVGLWLPDWAYVLERSSWLEPVRGFEEACRVRGERVAVYGIFGVGKQGGWWRARAGRLPRRAFPPLEGRWDGVVGWRAQLVAWYVLRRWPEFAVWRRWRQLSRGHTPVEKRAIWARRPRMPVRLRARLQRVAKGRAAWTGEIERAVGEALAEGRARWATVEAELRGVRRIEQRKARLTVGLLTGRVTLR